MKIVAPGVAVDDRSAVAPGGHQRLAIGRLAGRAIALGWAAAALPVVFSHVTAPAGTQGLLLAAAGVLAGISSSRRHWDQHPPIALHILLVSATLQACAALIALDARVLASIPFFAANALVAGLGLRGRPLVAHVALNSVALLVAAAFAPVAAGDTMSHAVAGAILVAGLGALPALIRRQRFAAARVLANRIARPVGAEDDFHLLHRRLAESVAADPDRFALLAMDIESLRAGSASDGELTGDSLIDEVARALAESVGSDAVIARSGNDGIAVLAPGADKNGAELLAHRIEETLARIEGPRIHVMPPAIGIAVFPEDGRTPDALLATAGEELERARQIRRGAVKVSRSRSAAAPDPVSPRTPTSTLPAMRTLVVSDLHLGARSGADVLRRPVALDALLNAVDDTDRLILLGDVLELRQAPLREAMVAAEPVIRAIGEAIGASGEVVIVPGNHDHRLTADWLRDRGRDAPAPPLELEQRPGPDASEPLRTIAGWLEPARLEVAYPGLWLRDDVYATHGHYLDRHTTLPTFERIGAGVMGRLVGPVPDLATPDDYEAALAPLYAWMHAMAEGARARSGASAPGSVGVWTALTGDGHRPLRGRILLGVLPIGIGTLNRLGLGPMRSDLSAGEVWAAGVRAMVQAVEHLELRARHVIFGHTHRAGPLPTDDSTQWTFTPGGSLLNTGCWVYEPAFLSRGRSSPFWPGAGVVIEDDAPPRLVRLLGDADPDALTAPG